MSTIKTLEERIKEIEATQQATVNADVAASDAVYDNKIKTVNDTYTTQIKDTEDSYVNAFKSNETQRFLNERAITRRAAELGLTDSGLNRTQQTAVQLSYANQKGELQRQKQKAINTLAAAMSSEVSALNAEKLSAAQGIKSAYAEAARSQANELYKADVETANELEIAKIEAQNKIDLANIEASQSLATKDNLYHFKRNETDGYGNKYSIFDFNGEEIKLAKGLNPYTRNNNLNSASVKAYGTFSNGYQPKGIIKDDYDSGTLKPSGKEDYVNGKKQTVWLATKTGDLFIWNGSTNEYELYEDKE